MQCMGSTAMVPAREKCTSSVPKLELKSPQPGAGETGKGEPVSWHGTCSKGLVRPPGAAVSHCINIRRTADGHDG